VIYLHSEDARETTIVPRLVAAGADLNRVIFVDAVTTAEGDEFESQVVLPSDVTELAELAIDADAALVVLDAATSVIDSRLDGDKDRQMRIGLESIARGIGERADCAVLGIVHFGKRDSADTGTLILGSIAWSQVARSVLAVAKDDETGDLVISATKSNIAPGDAASLSARLIDRGAGPVSRLCQCAATPRATSATHWRPASGCAPDGAPAVAMWRRPPTSRRRAHHRRNAAGGARSNTSQLSTPALLTSTSTGPPTVPSSLRSTVTRSAGTSRSAGSTSTPTPCSARMVAATASSRSRLRATRTRS
jgi:hypothetical protein